MPRTVQVLLIGFVILAVFALVGRLVGGRSGMLKAVNWFIPVWFAMTAYNMWEGVRVGHSVAGEIPFLLINFGIPAVVAVFLKKKFV